MNRWTVALHEAGHAVAGFALTGTRVVATLHNDGGGAAWPREELPPTDRAIMTAAGPIAESLAERHGPPEVEPSLGSQKSLSPQALPTLESVATPETAAALSVDIARAVPDHVSLARWCISGIEDQPLRWAQRHAWITRLATRLVGEHEAQIVEVARVLYLRGVVSVPLLERTAS
ncbi:MAG: hypothetical protein ACK54T_04775 [bacterium]|jgi:hypothetical protein